MVVLFLSFVFFFLKAVGICFGVLVFGWGRVLKPGFAAIGLDRDMIEILLPFPQAWNICGRRREFSDLPLCLTGDDFTTGYVFQLLEI